MKKSKSARAAARQASAAATGARQDQQMQTDPGAADAPLAAPLVLVEECAAVEADVPVVTVAIVDATAPAGMRSAPYAEASVDRMEAAFDDAAGAAHQQAQDLDATTAAFKARGTDLQLKLMEFTQLNIGAVFAFSRALMRAGEPVTCVRLGQDFTRERLEAFAHQSREIQSLTLALVSETALPMQRSLNHSLSSFRAAG